MKKSFKTIACLMAAGILATSCVGSFSLFNRLASWNKTATDNKFINEVLFIVCSPAYAVCGIADALVLNSIEFWTGDNPLASNIGKTQEIKGNDGLMYAVKTLKNGYEITNPDGKVFTYLYDKSTSTWSIENEGIHMDLFKFNADGTIEAYLPNGKSMNITADAAGLFELRMAVRCGDYSDYAMR